MPNIKSAKKKMRQDVKRTARNTVVKKTLKETVKNVKKADKVGTEDVQKAYSVIDKAAKKGIIHKNKAARLKSKVSLSANKKS